MKSGISISLAMVATLALSSCSDPDYVGMCLDKAKAKVSKDAEISITKKNVVKQGMSATVTISFTAATKKKDADDELAYFNASCIIKNDNVSRAFVRPASG